MPKMVMFTEVAEEASALIVSVAAITIEQLNVIVSFAAIATALRISKVLFSVPLVYSRTVTVFAEAVVFVKMICFTIVVVEAGTV
jgi:hypothetical protein